MAELNERLLNKQEAARRRAILNGHELVEPWQEDGKYAWTECANCKQPTIVTEDLIIGPAAEEANPHAEDHAEQIAKLRCRFARVSQSPLDPQSYRVRSNTILSYSGD